MLLALPRSPSNVRVSDVTPTSVRLSWSYDGDVQSEVSVKYIIIGSALILCVTGSVLCHPVQTQGCYMGLQRNQRCHH